MSTFWGWSNGRVLTFWDRSKGIKKVRRANGDVGENKALRNGDDFLWQSCDKPARGSSSNSNGSNEKATHWVFMYGRHIYVYAHPDLLQDGRAYRDVDKLHYK